MSYATYTTDAYVCGTFNRGTADRSYLLFTREAGMLFADAKSVREERSRQRFALQDFSRIRVSLVKGKQGWKVGSVEAIHNEFMRATSREARGSVVALFRLLRRFIHGEEAHTKLFDFVSSALDSLTRDLEQRAFVSLWVEVQILHALGYVDELAIPEVVRTGLVADIQSYFDERIEVQLRQLVAQAVSHSQL